MMDILKALDWSTILTVVLGLVTTVLGTKFVLLKNAIKEVGDVVLELNDALEDGSISKSELKEISKEANEALQAVVAIFK